MTAEKAFERKMKENGVRMTGPRRVIAKILSGARDHPDADELHNRIRKIDPHISLATIYRTLQLFEKLGIVERHSFGSSRAHYESSMHRHHDHFIDVRNGKVVEFHSPEIEALQAKIAARHGFRIVDHRLEIYVEPLKSRKKSNISR